jgi:hypothetical protein
MDLELSDHYTQVLFTPLTNLTNMSQSQKNTILKKKIYRNFFLANNQPDALFHVFIYFTPLHVSSITALTIRRSNCINTSSGMIPSIHLHRLIIPDDALIQFDIPDDVLIQFDLLMMSAVMLETCREVK